jgi:hypothetical protein
VTAAGIGLAYRETQGFAELNADDSSTAFRAWDSWRPRRSPSYTRRGRIRRLKSKECCATSTN